MGCKADADSLSAEELRMEEGALSVRVDEVVSVEFGCACAL